MLMYFTRSHNLSSFVFLYEEQIFPLLKSTSGFGWMEAGPRATCFFLSGMEGHTNSSPGDSLAKFRQREMLGRSTWQRLGLQIDPQFTVGEGKQANGKL